MNENGIWCQNGIPFLAPYSAKTELHFGTIWCHMVPHGAKKCQNGAPLFIALVFSANSTQTAIKCKQTAENLKLIYFF